MYCYTQRLQLRLRLNYLTVWNRFVSDPGATLQLRRNHVAVARCKWALTHNHHSTSYLQTILTKLIQTSCSFWGPYKEKLLMQKKSFSWVNEPDSGHSGLSFIFQTNNSGIRSLPRCPVLYTMEHRLQFTCILPMLLVTVSATQNVYNKIDPGQNITGTIGTQLKRRSLQECTLRWVKDCLHIAFFSSLLLMQRFFN